MCGELQKWLERIQRRASPGGFNPTRSVNRWIMLILSWKARNLLRSRPDLNLMRRALDHPADIGKPFKARREHLDWDPSSRPLVGDKLLLKVTLCRTAVMSLPSRSAKRCNPVVAIVIYTLSLWPCPPTNLSLYHVLYHPFLYYASGRVTGWFDLWLVSLARLA
jgi:hypothetical protein